MEQTNNFRKQELSFMYRVDNKDYMKPSDLKKVIASLKEERPKRIRRPEDKDESGNSSNSLSPEHLEFQADYHKAEEEQHCIKPENSTSEMWNGVTLPQEPENKIIKEPSGGTRKDVDYDQLINLWKSCGLTESEIFPEKDDCDEKGPGGYSLKRLDNLSRPKTASTLSDSKSKTSGKPLDSYASIRHNRLKANNTTSNNTANVKYVDRFNDVQRKKTQGVSVSTDESKICENGLSERLNRLAQPKVVRSVPASGNVDSHIPKSEQFVESRPDESQSRAVTPPAIAVGSSRRIAELAKPKIVPYKAPDLLPFPRPICKNALNAVASDRVRELARPKYSLI